MEHDCQDWSMIGYKRREGLTFYHCVQRSRRGKMHHRDEDDIICGFLLYAYKLAKEEEEQQQQQHTEQGRLGVAERRRRRRRRRPRSCWVRSWLSEDRRRQLGHYSTLLNRELRCEDVSTYTNYLRMPPDLMSSFCSSE